jgi:hypothetical protein
MKIKERLKAPTPNFWKRVQAIGITIGGLGAILVAPPVGLTVVGGYLITAGSVIGVLSQLTVEDGSVNN